MMGRAIGIAIMLALIRSASGAQATDAGALRQLLADGETAIKAGEPQRALDAFARALPQAERLGDDRILADTLAGLGWGQWATGKYADSLETRERALRLYRATGDIPRQALVLKGLGETLFGLGRYDEALQQYRLALDTGGNQVAARERGLILANIGSTYRSLGRLDEALKVLEESVSVLRRERSPGLLSQPYTFLGIISRARGEFDGAVTYYTAALEAARAGGNRRSESQILGNMGNVYLDLGQYDRALELFRQSLTIARAIAYTAQEGFSEQNIATTLNMIGRPHDALPHFEAALALWRRIDRPSQIGWTLVNLGVLRLHTENGVEAAREVFEEAIAIARKLKEPDLEGYALMNLGDTSAVKGDWPAALASYDEALAKTHQPDSPELEYELLSTRGAALHHLGRLNEAIASLTDAARIVNDMRARVSSDQSKIAFLDTRQAVFHHLSAALIDAGRIEASFEAAEAVRARALADLMQDRQLQTRAEARDAFLRVQAAVARTSTNDSVAAALAALRDRDRELASLVSADAPDAAEARSIAARLNATVLEYLVTDDAVIAWVLRDNTFHVQRIPIRASTLTREVRALLDDLNAPAGGARSRVARRLRTLYTDVVQPVAAWLPQNAGARLVIVPHAALMMVPFAALTTSDGAPLIERYTISYAPALSIFRYTAALREARTPNRAALIVADPEPPRGSGLSALPAAREEAIAVQRRLGAANVTLLTGPAATESTVKRAVESAGIIHLATHGLISEDRPLGSSLLLAEGAGDDGYLRADEIFALRLSADLVVLSGCSTGGGRVTGEGMLGLSRSFLYAGTPSLVVSDWDISDRATAYLMDRFYAALGRGEPKAAALRAAQLETRRRYADPALWAAFALIGEPD